MLTLPDLGENQKTGRPVAGQSEALRYGEKWRDLCGDKMVLAMFDTIVELRERAAEVEGLKDYINKLEVFRAMLSGLVHYLTNNYGDDHWDSTTRELLEEANDYIGNQPIVWNIEDEPDYSAEMPEGYVR
jgi:hypothetical protein